MHHTVQEFVARQLALVPVEGRRVLEVGSYNVNGTVRPLLEACSPERYVATDMRSGPGVDVVVDACGLVDYFGPGSFDVVVCCEVMEHVHDWRSAMRNMRRVAKPGGHLLLTTRSKGFPLHDFPHDYWRYEVADMHAILADWDVLRVEQDTLVAGVFAHAVRPLIDNSFAADLDAIVLGGP